MSPSVAQRRWRLAVRLNVAALVWSVGLIIAAVLLPVYKGQTVSNANGLTLTTATLVQVNGARALILLALPAIASVVVAVAMNRRRTHDARWSATAAWAATGLVAVIGLVGILSVGVFILPVAILLALTINLVPRAGAESARPGAPAVESGSAALGAPAVGPGSAALGAPAVGPGSATPGSAAGPEARPT